MKLCLNHSYRYLDLLEAFIELGYQRVDFVLEPGDFAVRGSIVDVFDPKQSHPIRIEFDYDIIIRLNSFLPNTQLSLSSLHTVTISQSSRISGYVVAEPDETVLSQFHLGDFVVHPLYGIGVYDGLTRLKLGEKELEYVQIRYKDEDKVYVPLDQLAQLHVYNGVENPSLHSLHDGGWQKSTALAKKAAQTFAQDLYLLYKLRTLTFTSPCLPDTPLQKTFEDTCPFVLTQDQKKAILDIKKDLEKPYPMDRLLCGDVGFGKTEVMLSSAFKMVDQNRQVAILVPTTILCEQHFRLFKHRFSEFPINVVSLSRFQKKKDIQDHLSLLKQGKIDVVIGTHRLLQPDVDFSDLGLLIVDEEQRFGVQHKEKIKKMKFSVHVLSVSATPIPRTLHLSLSGVRDLSQIQTPPPNKKPVITIVQEYSKEIIYKAISFEINRKGQVFYLFNRVETMYQKVIFLKTLFPDLRIEMAHGQMSPHVLQNVMFDFYHHRIDILVCSTIVENGMDILNMNTILIDSANKLGLSQIHQLRGRVGRSQMQGYAYLLIEKEDLLTDKARRRLAALRSYAALGSGYKLAMKDLEIRGGGALLGERQHGHVSAVGYELYHQYVEQAIHQEKGISCQKQPLNLNQHLIPVTFMPDERERLACYIRLLTAKNYQELSQLQEELKDRYGPLPQEILSIFDELTHAVSLS